MTATGPTPIPTLPTVILHHHDGPFPDHYDWLLTDPTRTDGYLWTARVAIPPDQWLEQSHFIIEPISHHRPHYLTYQGPLSDRRGQVTRIAHGSFTPEIWQPHDISPIIQITLHIPNSPLNQTRFLLAPPPPPPPQHPPHPLHPPHAITPQPEPSTHPNTPPNWLATPIHQ